MTQPDIPHFKDTPSLALDTETLAALVWELGSQLHIERASRLALEEALVSTGAITRAAVDAAASDLAARQRMQSALEESMRKLMQVLTENRDPRVPLRQQQK
jgi:cytidylate kinase